MAYKRGWTRLKLIQYLRHQHEHRGRTFNGAREVVAVDATMGYLDPKVIVSRAGAVGLVSDRDRFRIAQPNEPRWWYDPATKMPTGLLIESGRLPLWNNSGFPNGIADLNTRGGNYSDANINWLSGLLTKGVRFTPSTPTLVDTYCYRTVTVATGQYYAFECFVRMDDGSAPRIGGGSGNPNADFMLVLAQSGIAANQTAVELWDKANAVYRITGYINNTLTSGNGNFGICAYATNSGKSFVASGFNAFTGTYPCSYIPTGGVISARNDDNLYITDFSETGGVPPEYGCIEVEWSQTYFSRYGSGTDPAQGLIGFQAATYTDYLFVSIANGNGQIGMGGLKTGGTSFQANIAGPTGLPYLDGRPNRLVLRWNPNEIAASLNGKGLGKTTQGVVMANMKRLKLGSAVSNPGFLNGNLRQFLYQPNRRPTDQQMLLSSVPRTV